MFMIKIFKRINKIIQSRKKEKQMFDQAKFYLERGLYIVNDNSIHPFTANNLSLRFCLKLRMKLCGGGYICSNGIKLKQSKKAEVTSGYAKKVYLFDT